MNEEAMAYWGLSRQKPTNQKTLSYFSFPTALLHNRLKILNSGR
jgi:hypothetical protein